MSSGVVMAAGLLAVALDGLLPQLCLAGAESDCDEGMNGLPECLGSHLARAI